jgi:hypothetical protein
MRRALSLEPQNMPLSARIESTNGVPIVVERSLHWNAACVFWVGGTNALGTSLAYAQRRRRSVFEVNVLLMTRIGIRGRE